MCEGKNSLGDSSRAVEDHVIPDGILIEQSTSGADHSLCIALWVPGNTQLRSKVVAGSANPVAQPGPPTIQHRQRPEVAVHPSCVTHVAQSCSEGEIAPDFPGVSHVPLEAIIWS